MPGHRARPPDSPPCKSDYAARAVRQHGKRPKSHGSGNERTAEMHAKARPSAEKGKLSGVLSTGQ